MMSKVWYIGDEASAAGFRLAGAKVIVPLPGEERAALASAREQAALVLVSWGVARNIPSRELTRAERALTPLTLVVPGLRDDGAWPDPGARLRGQLGIEASR